MLSIQFDSFEILHLIVVYLLNTVKDMAEEQAGDDDAFLYGEDAEQEEVNPGSGSAEGANDVGAAEESRPVLY